MNSAGLAYPMLGSQLVGKSIINAAIDSKATKQPVKNATGNGKQQVKKAIPSLVKQNKQQVTVTATRKCPKQSEQNPNQEEEAHPKKQDDSPKSQPANDRQIGDAQETNKSIGETANSSIAKPKGHENCQTSKTTLILQEAQVQQMDHRPHEASPSGNRDNSIYGKDLEQLEKEAQELKIKLRKLQLEVEDKNEIINVLKDELENTKEQSDKFQREKIQLLKDASRVKFLQDENDFLQDKVGGVEKLELEIKRLKEKLQELDFLKLRIDELEEDRTKAQEESYSFEEKWKQAEIKASKVTGLEAELNKWKSFSHELEIEKNSIQNKLLESIEQEAKLNSINKKVEDEICRLRSVIKSHEERKDEEQASNSLIMSVADLNNFEANIDQRLQNGDNEFNSSPADTSIKYELDRQLEKELSDENKSLKDKLKRQENQLKDLEQNNLKIREELQNNRKLISELRQDLACKKNLELKLSSLSRQFKSSEKQYIEAKDNESTRLAKGITALESGPKSTFQESAVADGHIEDSSQAKSVIKIENLKLRTNLTSEPDKSELNKVNKCQGDFNSNGKITNQESQKPSATSNSKLSPDANAANKTSSKSIQAMGVSLREDGGKWNSNERSEFAADGQEPKLDNNRDLTGITLVKPQVPQAFASADNELSLTSSQTTSSGGSSLLLLSTGTIKSDPLSRTGVTTSSSDVPLLCSDDQSQLQEKKAISPSTDRKDELQDKPKHQHAHLLANNSKTSNSSDNKCTNLGISININGGKTSATTASVSPASSACSQSPSVATSIAGHDSGFQSINNDFNQISSPNSESIRKGGLTAVKLIANGLDVGPSEDKSSQKQENRTSTSKSNRSATIVSQQSAWLKSSAAAAPPLPSSSSSYATDAHKTPTPILTKDKPSSSSMGAVDPNFSKFPTQKSDNFNHSQVTSGSSNLGSINCTADESRASRDIIESRTTRGLNDDSKAGDTPIKRAPTPGKIKSSNEFVRNSMSSRSINFGHSKSPAYLDRIRASVTATTTTNTLSSFNEQTSNVTLGPQRHLNQIPVEPRYSLNCMLDHQHSQRCYTNATTVHSSQVMPGNYHNHPNPESCINNSSRQLNALIDPISQEQLMISLMHQNHMNYLPLLPNGLVDEAKLTRQQANHLAKIRNHHYYHHLQHMHDLHRMHHQHHMHMRHLHQNCQSKSGEHQQNLTNKQQIPCQRRPDLIGPGGSQFQAPSPQLEQVYANMSVNDRINHSNEQLLVNSQTSKAGLQSQLDPSSRSYHRQDNGVSPSRVGQQSFNSRALPQIDEMNGLPTINNNILYNNIKNHQNSPQPVITPEALTKQQSKQIATSSNNSPTSTASSPTSSRGSSNISPSSASSSSSLNSLSAGVPINRSALRHTTNNITRRQFSVERELVTNKPMTATLSRVGSCRASRSSEDAKTLCERQVNLSSMMREPIKTQQPSMRTSKILNIGQQSSLQHSQHQHPPGQSNGKTDSGELPSDNTLNRLTSNLANIKLNDRLAFSSLRAPKGSVKLNQMRLVNGMVTNGQEAAHNSLDRHNSGSQTSKGNNMNTDSRSNGKSAVWFEYGCV